MKKILVNRIAAILLIALSLSACSEDFLEQVNPNQLSTESFWQNITDLESGNVAIYGALRHPGILEMTDGINRSDLCFPGWGRPTTNNVFYLQTFTDANVNRKWAFLYRGIFRANQVIEAYETKLKGNLGNASNEEAGAMIYAQARALRGLFYSYLHSSYNQGSVPIFDFVPGDESEFFQPLSPEADVRAFFIADLEFGMENLPASWDGINLGKITSGACAALLGKTYLNLKDYAKASEFLGKVITDYNYSLTPDIGSNFTTRDEFNEESILEIAYSVDYTPEISGWSGLNSSNSLNVATGPGDRGGFRAIYPSCWLIMEYKRDPLDMADPRNSITRPKLDANARPEVDPVSGAVITETVPRAYSLRTQASIALADDIDTKYYQVETPRGSGYGNLETAYWRKYSNWDIVESERDVTAEFPRSGVNIRVIRLADIYLSYAEALIEGGTNDGGVDQALVYINRVRRRSGVRLLGPNGSGEYPINDHDNISYTASSLMNHLMYVERPLELSAEGHDTRILDMRRWGITKQRFIELAAKRYYAGEFSFTYIDPDTDKTETNTTFNSVLMDDGAMPANLKFNEYEKAAENYDDALHSYYPIPSGEVAANPKLFDNQ